MAQKATRMSLRSAALLRRPVRYCEDDMGPVALEKPAFVHAPVMFDSELAAHCAFPSLPMNYDGLGPSQIWRAARDRKKKALAEEQARANVLALQETVSEFEEGGEIKEEEEDDEEEEEEDDEEGEGGQEQEQEVEGEDEAEVPMERLVLTVRKRESAVTPDGHADESRLREGNMSPPATPRSLRVPVAAISRRAITPCLEGLDPCLPKPAGTGEEQDRVAMIPQDKQLFMTGYPAPVSPKEEEPYFRIRDLADSVPQWPELSEAMQYIIIHELRRAGMSFIRAVRCLGLDFGEITSLVELIRREQAKRENFAAAVTEHTKASEHGQASYDIAGWIDTFIAATGPHLLMVTDVVGAAEVARAQAFMRFMGFSALAAVLDNYRGTAVGRDSDLIPAVEVDHFIADGYAGLPPQFNVGCKEELTELAIREKQRRRRERQAAMSTSELFVRLDAPDGTINPQRLDPDLTGHHQANREPVSPQNRVWGLHPSNYEIPGLGAHREAIRTDANSRPPEASESQQQQGDMRSDGLSASAQRANMPSPARQRGRSNEEINRAAAMSAEKLVHALLQAEKTTHSNSVVQPLEQGEDKVPPANRPLSVINRAPVRQVADGQQTRHPQQEDLTHIPPQNTAPESGDRNTPTPASKSIPLRADETRPPAPSKATQAASTTAQAGKTPGGEETEDEMSKLAHEFREQYGHYLPAVNRSRTPPSVEPDPLDGSVLPPALANGDDDDDDDYVPGSARQKKAAGGRKRKRLSAGSGNKPSPSPLGKAPRSSGSGGRPRGRARGRPRASTAAPALAPAPRLQAVRPPAVETYTSLSFAVAGTPTRARKQQKGNGGANIVHPQPGNPPPGSVPSLTAGRGALGTVAPGGSTDQTLARTGMLDTVHRNGQPTPAGVVAPILHWSQEQQQQQQQQQQVTAVPSPTITSTASSKYPQPQPNQTQVQTQTQTQTLAWPQTQTQTSTRPAMRPVHPAFCAARSEHQYQPTILVPPKLPAAAFANYPPLTRQQGFLPLPLPSLHPSGGGANSGPGTGTGPVGTHGVGRAAC